MTFKTASGRQARLGHGFDFCIKANVSGNPDLRF